MSGFIKIFGAVLAVLLVALFVGPRPDTSQNISFDAATIGQDIDAYLKASEERFDDMRDGVEKEIVWADPATKFATETAILYLHGFSATKRETAPVAQNLASEINANLFLTRLSGHGRDGDALADVKLSDWLDDVAEAIAIGKRIGRKIIIVSASTGSTLATWAAARPEFSDAIAGMVLISPNYAIKGASTGLLNMPWAETLLPMVFGQDRSFEPSNEDHGKFWTTAYPSKSIFPMAALLRVVDDIDKNQITTPAMFIYSDDDQVVMADKTDDVVANWGGPTEVLKINDSADPNNHVIAGDILSPNTTNRVTSAIIDWVKSL